MALGLTLLLTEMITRNLTWGGRGVHVQLAREAYNFTANFEQISLENVGNSTSHNSMGLHGQTYFSYIDVPASQETRIRAPTVHYGESFPFLFVDDVRTSQEAHIRASVACYGESFIILYVDAFRTSQETHTSLHVLLRGILLHFYM
jgi:hypothetical protein